MPSALPDGVPAPHDGLLPDDALERASTRDFGVYVHIPFCRVRCGYCDFNTYTTLDMPGVSQGEYAELANAEVRFAGTVVNRANVADSAVKTVFFGGGTPTLLSAAQLASILETIDEVWGTTSTAEVTVEANPDTVDAAYLGSLVEAGVTRMSFGVQSFAEHVLATLDRTHNPDAVAEVIAAAKREGLQVSIDLIYGTPGESALDWNDTLDRALELEPDHISAYSLIVEPGTALARRVDRGELAPIDDDVQAEFYELADDAMTKAGFEWYEVSNWAHSVEARSRHNISYWSGENWWGVGPGAHSHVGGVRWWNVKHPKAYAQRLRSGVSPALARENLDDDQRYTEEVMLSLRTVTGLATQKLRPGASLVVAQAIADGLVDPAEAMAGRLVLTRKGRLLADGLGIQLLSA